MTSPPIHNDWFFTFLNEVTDAVVLSKIAREIRGNYDEEQDEEVKDRKNQKKHPSPTLRRILSRHWDIDDDDTCNNEWTCFVALFHRQYR